MAGAHTVTPREDISALWWQEMLSRIPWRIVVPAIIAALGWGTDEALDQREHNVHERETRAERLHQLEVEHALLLDLYAAEAALDSCLAVQPGG